MGLKFGTLGFVAIGIVLSGCAHMHPVQGTQAKAEIPEGIRVGIGGKEVKDGDKVNVLKSVCQTVASRLGGARNTCHDQKVGEATVLKVLDHDSAIVRPDVGLAMDSTLKVEKK